MLLVASKSHITFISKYICIRAACSRGVVKVHASSKTCKILQNLNF